MSAAPYESAPYDTDDRPVTVERREGPYGEVVLWRRGQGAETVWEIIANGCFLMDTSDGRSERLLMRAALNALTEGAESGVRSGSGPGSTGDVGVVSTKAGAPSPTTASATAASDESEESASTRAAEARCAIHGEASGGDSVDGSALPGTSGSGELSRPGSGRGRRGTVVPRVARRPITGRVACACGEALRT